MKRIWVLVLISVFCFAGLAAADGKEIDGGTIMVGGGSSSGLMFGDHEVKPQDQDTVNADSTLFNLNVFGGYFLQHGIEVGPYVGFNYAKFKMDQGSMEGDGTTTMWDFGAQGAYIYDMGRKEDWAPYGMLALAYMSGKSDSTQKVPPGGDVKMKTDFSGWTVTPRGGIMFFLIPRFAVDASLFFKYISASGTTENGTSTDFDAKSNNYGIAVGLNGFIN